MSLAISDPSVSHCIESDFILLCESTAIFHGVHLRVPSPC
uniref:Uncharacterized protein n=1 Tax=Anguilla anguilla TaxID=7936 RepID=A0A0E9S0Z9_ANGAN